MLNKRVIIVCLHGYSGGILVISLLCKLLIEKGVDAKLFYVHKKPLKGENMIKFWLNWFIDKFKPMIYSFLIRIMDENNKHVKSYRKYLLKPFKDIPVKRTPFFAKKDTIVIYPDSVYGNFLDAKNVVRYFLYYNPFPNDIKDAYGKDDLFIAFREVFSDININPNNNLLQLNYFDENLYCRSNYGPRSGNCYIIRKGRYRKDVPEHFDGPIIDDLSEEEKVKVLNGCEFCYSYDLQTFYSRIAAICGCKSIIVFEPGKTAVDYYSKEEIHNHFGVAYGNTQEEIKHAQETVKELKEKLDYRKSNEEQIYRFIELLRLKFDSNKP